MALSMNDRASFMTEQGTLSLAQRLAALINGAPVSATYPEANTNAATRANDMASSTTQWTSEVLALVGERLLNDAAIIAAQHPGVTRSRIRAVLPDHLKAQDEQLLHWLDAAEVLAPPITLNEPFRHPRRILCTTVRELVERLCAMPHPGLNRQPGGHLPVPACMEEA